MKRLCHKYLQLLKGRDKGTVAITFLLSLPILLTIIGVMVQYALLANARLTLDRAVAAAARSAMTSLPIDPAIGDAGGQAYVYRAALMTLESLSPVGPNVSSEGQTVADALAQVGSNPPASYAARYTFAQDSSQIVIQPIDGNGNAVALSDFAHAAAPRVRITISYNFQLTVPGVNATVGQVQTVSGVTGHFMTLTSSLDVQLSHGREAPTNGNGDP